MSAFCVCFLICVPTGPPVIVSRPKNIFVNMSHNAMLRCHAVADPPNMTYIWQKDGENVYHVEWVDLFLFDFPLFPFKQSFHPSGSDNHWNFNMSHIRYKLHWNQWIRNWLKLIKTWTRAKFVLGQCFSIIFSKASPGKKKYCRTPPSLFKHFWPIKRLIIFLIWCLSIKSINTEHQNI